MPKASKHTRRRTVVLSAGSVKNSYLPLGGLIDDFFPKDTIGGRSAQHAARALVLSFGLDHAIKTDIDGGKQIFRKRAWVRTFLRAHRLKAGDRVVIEELGPYRYHLYPEPTESSRDSRETTLAIEAEHEDDGRWIAEVADLPGVLAYGATREEATARAKALALRVIADRLEHGEATPAGPRISFAMA